MQPNAPAVVSLGMLTVEQGCRPGRGPPLPIGLLHGGAALLAVSALMLWLQVLGRPFLCPCGAVRIWAPAHDSQHFADWYSLLHISFGFALFTLVAHFQPRWSLSLTALVAVFGSVAWEAIENLPAVIAMFNPPAGSQSYAGDTILNALGDTLFVLAGCFLAARLSRRSMLAVALLIEAVVWLAIGDGMIIGAARLAIGS